MSGKFVAPAVLLIFGSVFQTAFASYKPPEQAPARESRLALLRAHIDSLPLTDSTVKWLNRRFDGTVQELITSDAHFWRLALMRNSMVQFELENYLNKNGLRLGMTDLEVRNYAQDGKRPTIADQSNIQSAGFSLRTLHPLVRAKILTIGELHIQSDSELLNLPGFGKTNLYEVKRFFEELECSQKLESSD